MSDAAKRTFGARSFGLSPQDDTEFMLAGVAKLADAQVLGTCSREGLEVQVLSPAHL